MAKVFEEHNYEPNALARAMKTGRTDTVGVFMTRVRSPFHAALLDAICRKLADSRLHMTLWNLEHDSVEFAAQAAHRNLVDGFMFTSAVKSSKVERAAVRSGIPSVLVHRGVEDLACDQVLGDNRSGAHEAATYLARAGHTRIGLVTTGNREASNIRDREDGFRAGLEQAGIELPQELVVLADGPVHIPGGAEHRSGHAAVRHLMSLDNPPSAIFAVTDLQAFGVLDGARSLGISVPEQLWVVGFDDVEMASWESFDLTTVNQPIEELVTTAIELLQRRLIDPSAEPKTVILPCSLIMRGSTGHTTGSTS